MVSAVLKDKRGVMSVACGQLTREISIPLLHNGSVLLPGKYLATPSQRYYTSSLWV